MSVIVDFSIYPMDKGDQSLSPYVARAIDTIRKSGLSYKLGPMGTAIEGEWDDIMAVVDECYRALEPDSDRLFINLKVDSKKGRKNGLSEKVASVEEKTTAP
jgi:uncharacterized protein (TIGR00106 family)